MVLDKTAFVSRLEKNPSNYQKESYVTFSGGFPGGIPINIQIAGAMFTSLHEGVQGKMFIGFTTASGVVEGHKLTISGTTDEYVVKGRAAYELPAGAHYELTLVKGTI